MADEEIIKNRLEELQGVVDEDEEIFSREVFDKGLQNVYVANYRVDVTQGTGDLYAILEVRGAEDRNQECKGSVYLKLPTGKTDEERAARRRAKKFFAGLGFQRVEYSNLSAMLTEIQERVFRAFVSPSRNSEDFVNCDPRGFVQGGTEFGDKNPF